MIDVLERILELKNERGWSLYKLADEADLPQSTVANMFPRKTLPSLYTLSQICEAFGITMSEFFNDGIAVDEETRLLSSFRKLDEKDRNTVLALSEYLRKTDEQGKSEQ
ncbi:MAG: helix-turn-helix transcriptional regulator [Clostridia bacterium]|nr:helix-turn-helix transcriptional regulator [Clostridia bacterium]